MKKNNSFQPALTDLHTHILPAVDDGAKDLDTALEMLKLQKQSGVERVMLTPHYLLEEPTQDFLERRQQGYEALMEQWCAETMPQLRLGAEVRYCPQLIEADLRSLTLGESNYLLLELPAMEVPAYLEQVLEEMRRQGITPVLAHVERCVYFRVQPERLKKLIDMGALAQITGRVIYSRGEWNFVKACLKNGLAHIIASDLHDPEQKQCLGMTAQKMEPELVSWTEEFAKCIWENTCPPIFSAYPVKKGFFGYY